MIYVTGATGGIGGAIIKNAIQLGMEYCAIVREPKNLYLDNDMKSTEGLVIDYNLRYIPKPNSHDANMILVLAAYDIVPIKMISELTYVDILNNVEFNVVKQMEVVKKILQFSNSWQIPLRIINLSSGAANNPISGWSLYCSGKAYINMFLRVLSQENSIPIVLYDPGIVDTKMQEYIRSIDKRHFPKVHTFQDFYTTNSLNSPVDIAHDIFRRYILEWTATRYEESFNKV
jgi:benzil reductase ((S)-benzoin forming)